MRKCKDCSTEIPKVKDCSTFHEKKGYCSIDCAAVHSLKKVKDAAEKAEKKVHAARKRKHYESDIPTRQKAAKTACHLYIRTRDKDELCICCDEPLGEGFHAGHFLESGNNSKLRYHEDNIHGQRVYCNKFKGGDSDDYPGRLRLKIGDARVDYLLANKGGAVKRTAADYKDIEDYYTAKLKEIINDVVVNGQ